MRVVTSARLLFDLLARDRRRELKPCDRPRSTWARVEVSPQDLRRWRSRAVGHRARPFHGLPPCTQQRSHRSLRASRCVRVPAPRRPGIRIGSDDPQSRRPRRGTRDSRTRCIVRAIWFSAVFKSPEGVGRPRADRRPHTLCLPALRGAVRRSRRRAPGLSPRRLERDDACPIRRRQVPRRDSFMVFTPMVFTQRARRQVLHSRATRSPSITARVRARARDRAARGRYVLDSRDALATRPRNHAALRR